MLTTIHANPAATAKIRGSGQHAGIRGKVDLYDTYEGTILIAEVYGLPAGSEESGDFGGFHGFHIHDGSSCTGDAKDPFADTGKHYDPAGKPHPQHAGDLPPLLSNHGAAWMAVYTARFYPEDVIGKTVVIHGKMDDFHTQPSGDSGEKIACGEIVAWEADTR